MKAIPVRMDISTRNVYPMTELLRFVIKDGMLTLDASHQAKGRGYYLYPSKASYQTALKKKCFERILHRPLKEEEISLIEEAIHG